MDRVLELRPTFEPDMVKALPTTLSLAVECISLAKEVQSLMGRFEVIQILRAFVVAHIFRYAQFSLRNKKLPSFSYMGKVFLFYQIPITVVIGAFYTITHIFPSSSPLVRLAQSLLLSITLFIHKPGMEVKQDSSNTNLVLHQHNYDAANNDSMISSATNLSPSGTEGTMDLQVADHFITNLLAGFCVDLVVQLERLQWNFVFPHMLIVLGIKHIPCFMQLVFGKNKVPPVYYLRNVLLSYDISVTIFIAVIYVIFRMPSNTLVIAFFLELSLLLWIDIFMPKRKELNDSSRWIQKDRIGSGAFGTVLVAQNKETGAIAAVKVLKDNLIAENVESIHKEIKFLRELEHPNIVKYLDHEIVGRDIYLYMEYIQPGSLEKTISKQGVLHEPLIKNFTTQILSGLVYLHNERVVHRDIKPDHILLGPSNTIKLADFGLAKHLNDSMGNHSKLGTYAYAAPEVFRGGEYNSSPEAYAADIWSLGCVIIEMFTGQIPWSDSKMDHPRIEELCPEGKDFLERCFKKNPEERASAEELLSHPFVRGTN